MFRTIKAAIVRCRAEFAARQLDLRDRGPVMDVNDVCCQKCGRVARIGAKDVFFPEYGIVEVLERYCWKCLVLLPSTRDIEKVDDKGRIFYLASPLQKQKKKPASCKLRLVKKQEGRKRQYFRIESLAERIYVCPAFPIRDRFRLGFLFPDKRDPERCGGLHGAGDYSILNSTSICRQFISS